MTDRRALVATGLRAHLNDDIELIQVTDPEWIAAHPSGFGTISPCSEGDFFEYNPQIIIETVDFLTEDDDGLFALYVNSISEWWLFSTVRSADGMTSASILDAYTQQAPDSVLTFAVAAEHNGCDLATWLNVRWASVS